MKIKNNKHFAITVILLGAILLGKFVLSAPWRNIKNARAITINGPEQNANSSQGSKQQHAGVSMDEHGNFVMVWESQNHPNDGNNGDSDKGIFFRRFNSNGKPIDPKDNIVNKTRGGDQKNPGIVMDKNGNFIVVWEGTGIGDNDGIFAQAFDKNGRRVGDEWLVNTVTEGMQSTPRIALDYDNNSSSGTFAITWQGPIKQKEEETFPNDKTDSHRALNLMNKGIYLQRYSIDFTKTAAMPNPAGDYVLVNSFPTNDESSPDLAMNNFGEIMVTWSGPGVGFEESSQIWLQAYGNNGAAWGREEKNNPGNKNMRVNSNNLVKAQKPGIASDKSTHENGGNFIITYGGSLSTDDHDGGIFARGIKRCNPENCALNLGEVGVNTSIAHQTFDDGLQESSAINADGFGNFTVVWHDHGSHDQNEMGVFAQNFRMNGVRLNQTSNVRSQFQVNTTTFGNQKNPAIAMSPDGTYVIGFDDESENRIKFQMYTSELFKKGAERLAHQADNTTQQYALDTAVGPHGETAAVWVNLADHHIYAGMWDQNNNIIVENLIIDDEDSNNHANNPSLSFFKDSGRLVVVWEGTKPSCYNGTDSAGTDIWYREIGSNGELQGSCEKKVNDLTMNDGHQTHPDVAAGYYNYDGGDAEDVFVISYIHESAIGEQRIETAFHKNSEFTIATVEPNCVQCQFTQVALNPENNHTVYAWDNNPNAIANVSARLGKEGNLSGTAFMVHSTPNFNQSRPDAAFLSDDEFVIVSTQSSEDNRTAKVVGKRYAFHDGGTPITVDDTFEINKPENPGLNVYGKIAADQSTGDALIVWTSLPENLSDNQIYGQFFEFKNATAGGFRKYGEPLRINSTQAGNQTLPSAGMNQKGDIIVGWEGRMDTANGNNIIDNDGIIIQTLRNPLFAQQLPSLEPIASQEILQGGKTLMVPTTINFPSTSVSTMGNSPPVEVSIRDVTHVAPIQYIAVEDLDGIGFNITVSVSDFTFTDKKTYIRTTDIAIKNCDTVSTDVACVEANEGNASDITLNPVINSFARFTSNSEQKTLATKNGSNLGKWRLYPAFQLIVPELTPPGDHTATITFSLQ